MHNDTCDLPGELITTADQFHVIVRLNDMMNQQQSDTPTTRSNHASSPLNGTPTENSRFASALYTSPRKLQVALNPRYVSKFSPSLRMRPYYIPRRSRTKSENNAEPMSSLIGHQFQDLIPAANSTELVDDDDEDDVDLQPSTSSSSVSSATPFARLTHRNSMMTIDDDTSGELPQSQEQQTQTQFDAMASARSTVAMMEKFLAVQQQQSMRKSRSMEDICRGVRSTDAGLQASHEMEFMSSRIQKMKVQD